MLHISPCQLTTIELNEERNYVESSVVLQITCCLYFASSTSANTPAASGAAADVPECFKVH